MERSGIHERGGAAWLACMRQMRSIHEGQCGIALMEATKKWTQPIPNWGLLLNKFMAIFEQRVKV